MLGVCLSRDAAIMRPSLRIPPLLILSLLAFAAHAAPGVGDPAPDWTLQGSDGAEHRLADLRGTHVVLAFFPKAFTGGCTIECKSLRDAGREIRAFDVRYFMASTDEPADNRAFAEQNDADFPVLSDPDGTVSAAYGVLTPGGMARRWTFYIDPQGVLRRIDRDVNPRTAGEALVRTLEDLDVPPAAADPA
jgi:peroxiredoxin Q/BCP